MSECIVKNCIRSTAGKHKNIGYCSMHYQRFKKYGDPSRGRIEVYGELNPSYRHGQATIKTKEYMTWSRIKQRTTNPNNPSASSYYARGIKVCDRWLESFENFLEDMGKAPSKNHSIDRIDVNGNYEPSNCRWATAKEQAANTRTNRNITYNGETLIMSEWSRRLGISPTSLDKRLKKGWPLEKALTLPHRDLWYDNNSTRLKYNNKEMTLHEWAEYRGIKVQTLYARLHIYRWSVERALNYANRA